MSCFLLFAPFISEHGIDFSYIPYPVTHASIFGICSCVHMIILHTIQNFSSIVPKNNIPTSLPFQALQSLHIHTTTSPKVESSMKFLQMTIVILLIPIVLHVVRTQTQASPFSFSWGIPTKHYEQMRLASQNRK